MWTTDTGIRFELSPWRARRVIAQVKEIARRRREGQTRLPGGVLHDLQRMVRFARPAGKLAGRDAANRMRMFEAALPDGVLRMMTQSSPGSEMLMGVAFRANAGELEQEAQYGGRFAIKWLVAKPVPLGAAIGRIPPSPGVYLIFRRTINGWTLKYVGKGENLRERLGTRFGYARQQGDADQLGVMYGVVQGATGDPALRGVGPAEHALIRTLDPRARMLSNRSSIRQFRARPQGLVIESVLPSFLRRSGMGFNPAYDVAGNRVVVSAGSLCEFGP